MGRLAIGLVAVVAACGGDDGGTTMQKDAAVDSKMVDAKVFMDAPPPAPALTIKNELAWCEITINGGPPSTSSTITSNVAPGVITLVAKAAPNGTDPSLFKITANMWHHTDGDSGTGETGTVAGTGDDATSTVMATVVSGTPKCVWVCCPFKNGSGCGTTDLCP